MIVGTGLLARSFMSRFATRSDTLIFASGVSNSHETSRLQFDREFEMLAAMRRDHTGRLVYFGSCSVTDDDRRHTPYARHKLAMEEFVVSDEGGLVVRLPQVVGRTENPHTLTNFLHDRIESGESFSIWANAERNLIDVDDVAAITEVIIAGMEPSESRVVTIASERSISMPALMTTFERVLGKKANYSLEEKGGRLHIDARFAQQIARQLGIDLGEGYVERLLRKYYGRPN
ncbi:NAD-dependent epimerase/dehydratase family protein [Luteimonas salinilitoris]|uniref:NAD-dependent epimerase/dehydratase family protein n=1 Tax=Luteimonas salinilitoris TaxID=3237697 RepID=A0ABV4HWX0_9GAMM